MNLAYGSFSGDPIVRMLSQGRNMQLVEDCFYTDPDGKVWPALAGDIIDGASIPKMFWTLYGGPFEGIYRIPSVFHDHACDHYQTIAERREADKMFRTACLCAGCSPTEADVLFKAVSLATDIAEREGKDHGPKAFAGPAVNDGPGGVGWH